MEIKELLPALSEPFTGSDLQTYEKKWVSRTGDAKSLTLTYAQVSSIIRRLNEVFGGDWNFVIKEYFINSAAAQIVVLGQLTACGVTKEAFGGDAIVDGEENIINAYKGACGDAIRLCARQFGVGLHLWEKTDTPSEKPAKTQATSASASRHVSNGSAAIGCTERQWKFLCHAIDRNDLSNALRKEAANILDTELVPVAPKVEPDPKNLTGPYVIDGKTITAAPSKALVSAYIDKVFAFMEE